MTRPLLTVARHADRIVVSLAAIEPGDRRGTMPAVEVLCRKVGMPQDISPGDAEIHVLLVDLAPPVAVEELRRAADAIGIDVATEEPQREPITDITGCDC